MTISELKRKTFEKCIEHYGTVVSLTESYYDGLIDDLNEMAISCTDARLMAMIEKEKEYTENNKDKTTNWKAIISDIKDAFSSIYDMFEGE